jgi:hypothetical protein
MKFCLLVLTMSSLVTLKTGAQDFLLKTIDAKTQYQLEVKQRSDEKIMGCIYHVYELESGNVTDQRFVNKVEKFNRNGTINEIRYLAKGNKLRYITVFEYSDIYPSKISTYVPSGELVSKEEYVYNSNFTLKEYTSWDGETNTGITIRYKVMNDSTIREERYGNTGLIHSYVYTLNKWGKSKRYEKYNETNDLVYYVFHRYENHKIIQDDFYTPSGEIAYSIFYSYDENGLLAKEEKKTPRNKQIYRYIYQYNGEGLLISHIKYGRNNTTDEYYKYTYEFFP